MSKETTKKFVENNGFICNKCGKVVVDGHKHKNEEDLCNQCKIADLEAKLAQAQKTIEIQKMSNDALIDENLDYRYDITDTAYERAKEMAESWQEDYQQEIAQLKQQLEEKNKKQERTNKVVEQFQQRVKYFSEKDQDKISFAVAYLEIIKAFIIDKEFYFVGEDYSTVYVEDITEEIDNQIKALKEGK